MSESKDIASVEDVVRHLSELVAPDSHEDLAATLFGVTAIRSAIALLSALEKDALRWVPVSERLPKHDGFYLVASSDPRPPDVYVLELRAAEYPEHAHWRATGEFRGCVTHWRPLPAPPAIDLARGRL